MRQQPAATMVTHERRRTSHTFHLLMTLLTAGLWAPLVWLPVAIMNSGTRPVLTHVYNNNPTGSPVTPTSGQLLPRNAALQPSGPRSLEERLIWAFVLVTWPVVIIGVPIVFMIGMRS